MPKRQFSPVAAAATSAIDATNRTLTTLQNKSGLPQLPAQPQGIRSARNAINTVSQFDPANVLFASDGPSVPMPGQGNKKSGGPPSPQAFLPDNVANALPTPPWENQRSSTPTRPPAGGSGNGKSSGGSTSTSTTSTASGPKDARAGR